LLDLFVPPASREVCYQRCGEISKQLFQGSYDLRLVSFSIVIAIYAFGRPSIFGQNHRRARLVSVSLAFG